MRHIHEINGGVPIIVNPYNEYYCAGRHTHDFIEIKYIISGRGRHIINGYEMEVSSGDIYVINKGSSHYFLSDKQNPIIAYNLNAANKLTDSVFENPFCSSMSGDFLKKPFVVLKDDQLYIQTILSEMHSESINKKPGFSETLYADYIKILVYISRWSNDKTDEDKKKGNDPIFNIVTYLDEHYVENISLDSLAKMANYNPSYLSRRFKQIVGVGIFEYIHKIRVNRACIYLRESKESFATIAYKIGYENENYFRSVFKRIVGKNPKDYRNEVKGQKLD